MQTENLSTLKIHQLSEEQYKREKEAGRLDESAMYLTPISGLGFERVEAEQVVATSTLKGPSLVDNDGAVDINGELYVSDMAEFMGNVIVDNHAHVVGDLDVDGAVTISGNGSLQVFGPAEFAGGNVQFANQVDMDGGFQANDDVFVKGVAETNSITNLGDYYSETGSINLEHGGINLENGDIIVGGEIEYLGEPLENVIEGIASEVIKPIEDDLRSKTDASYNKIVSRGEQLIVNGSGLMGDNTNFSSWTFDGAVANNSTGSFTYEFGQRPNNMSTDEFFPVNPAKTYSISIDAKSQNGLMRLYSYLAFYDADKLPINAYHHMYLATSTTTLAQDLNPGDTTIYLTDLSGWNVAQPYGAKMIIWNYTNSFGYTYPVGTYSRNRILLPEDAATRLLDSNCIDFTNNTITLTNAYNGEAIPAGTPVSQGADGATYKYMPLVNTTIPTTWQTYSGSIGGVDLSGTNIANQFPPGVAYCKFGFLWNYHTDADQAWITNISVTEALSNVEADTAKKLKTSRKISLDTGVTSTAASFDGSSDIAIPVTDIKESYLSWGGKNIIEGISPISAALSAEHSANRIAYLDPNAITIEYSNDAGATWVDSNISDDYKTRLVTTTATNVTVGSDTPVTTNHRTRIMLAAADGINSYLYARIRKMLINVSTPHGLKVIIEAKKGAADVDWEAFGTYDLAGWSAWNDIPLYLVTFGNNSQPASYWYLRLTFEITSLNSNSKYLTSPSQILGLRLFGDTCWGKASNMGETGHLYAYDELQNAYFPAQVQATSFIGSLNGTANVANKLGNNNLGDATKPIYLSGGYPQLCSGTLMSTDDKTHLDAMWNIWAADDANDALVNKVAEVLAIFQNYPEGDTIVSALASKVTAAQVEEIVNNMLKSSVYAGETEDIAIINFTIDGDAYQAEGGMSWFEWVNSDYNTGIAGQYPISCDSETSDVTFVAVMNYKISDVIGSTIIENGHAYAIESNNPSIGFD